MKAVLVIDVDDKYLGKEISLIKFTDNNGIYCSEELKPIPEKRILPEDQTTGTAYGVDPWFSDGWNACLDEITGETE